MRILDNYIIKSVLKMFAVCVGTFLFLYIVIDVLSCLDDLLKQRVNIWLLNSYYLSYLPMIFVQVAPFCCLLSTLYTFALLNRGNEIIAMRTSGVSIFGITKTVLLFGFLISIFIFWVGDRFVPQCLSLSQKLKYQMEHKAKKPDNEIINNLSMYGLGNRLFFVNKFSLKDNIMEGIVILEQDKNQNITKKVVANKGAYMDNKWVFYQSITSEFDVNGQIKNGPKYADQEIMPIPEAPEEFLSQKQSTDLMNISQLNDYIWKLSKSGATGVVQNLLVDLYNRYTAPLASLVIILLGIPFSLKIKKRAAGISSLAVSIILAFLYYVLNAVSLALGKAGALPAVLSASLSHLIALTISFYLIFELR